MKQNKVHKYTTYWLKIEEGSNEDLYHFSVTLCSPTVCSVPVDNAELRVLLMTKMAEFKRTGRMSECHLSRFEFINKLAAHEHTHYRAANMILFFYSPDAMKKQLLLWILEPQFPLFQARGVSCARWNAPRGCAKMAAVVLRTGSGRSVIVRRNSEVFSARKREVRPRGLKQRDEKTSYSFPLFSFLKFICSPPPLPSLPLLLGHCRRL